MSRAGYQLGAGAGLRGKLLPRWQFQVRSGTEAARNRAWASKVPDDGRALLGEIALKPAPSAAFQARLQAVPQLWCSAADGLDSDGGIESTLKAALDDPDEAIAKMAEKALADLKALAESRALD